MRWTDLFLFQVGDAAAIRRTATAPRLVLLSALLVLTAAMARNYDQNYIVERPWWPVAGMIFSLVSSLIIYCFVYLICHRKRDETPKFARRYLVFLGLFWMTSPLAWLYAVPVERFLSSRDAAIANAIFLAIVSLWRVLLLPRAWSVVTGLPFKRVFGVVLLPAGLEMFFVSCFSALSVVGIMGGMVHSPEEEVIILASGIALWVGVAGIVLSIVVLIWTRGLQGGEPAAVGETSPVTPVFAVLGLLALWVLITVPAQLELRRTHHLKNLVRSESYDEAVAYVSQFQPGDFSPVHRLPPDPYKHLVFRRLPGMLSEMTPDTPEWVRKTYLEYLRIMSQHRWGLQDPDPFLQILNALERLPEGREWIGENEAALKRMGERLEQRENYESATNKLSELLRNDE